MKQATFATVAAFAGFTAAAAHAQVIDFEGSGVTGNATVTALGFGAYNFTSSHYHLISNPALFGGSSSGSDYIGHEGGSVGSQINMNRFDGAAFSIFGVDAAELWAPDNSGFPNAALVRVTGNFASGGSITQLLQLDGLTDGVGGIADFESFALAGFIGLRSVEFEGVGANGGEPFAFGIDNVRLVPAPGAAALLGLGGLLASRRRR